MGTQRVIKTVKVLIHMDTAGNIALGVIESEWRGAHRVDRRLSAARPTAHRVAHAPRGVEPAVWLACMALRDLVDEQEQRARLTEL